MVESYNIYWKYALDCDIVNTLLLVQV